MSKRTKRYGGFRIGDRVQRKDGKFIKFQPALVIGFSNGYIRTHWTMNDGTYFESVFAPNQLINLTRIEESKRKITDPLPPFPKGLAEELNKRCEEYLKIINQDDFMKDFKPTPFENLLKRERLVPKSEMNERLRKQEERERNKEQLDKFTRKHFNQSSDEYLKETIELTKEIIEDFGKPLELPPFDWLPTDFGEIQVDFCSKGWLKEPTPDPLPSPYTRDVYSFTKDFD